MQSAGCESASEGPQKTTEKDRYRYRYRYWRRMGNLWKSAVAQAFCLIFVPCGSCGSEKHFAFCVSAADAWEGKQQFAMIWSVIKWGCPEVAPGKSQAYTGKTRHGNRPSVLHFIAHRSHPFAALNYALSLSKHSKYLVSTNKLLKIVLAY